MKLYLIGGKADSGKNFFGDILKKKFEEEGKKVCMLRITAPLYNYAKEYFNWNGEEKTKPRELLQTLGIEVIREKLGMKSFLVDRLTEDIKILDNFFDTGIITDGRLIYEFDLLKERFKDIKIIKMERKNYKNNLTEKQNNHLTEKDLDNPYDYDYVVENESLDNLLKAADRIVKEALWVFK